MSFKKQPWRQKHKTYQTQTTILPQTRSKINPSYLGSSSLLAFTFRRFTLGCLIFFPSREQRICPLNPEYLCWASRNQSFDKYCFPSSKYSEGLSVGFFPLWNDSYQIPTSSFPKEGSTQRVHPGQVWSMQGTLWTTSCTLNQDP